MLCFKTGLRTQYIDLSKDLWKMNKSNFAQLFYFCGLNWIGNYRSCWDMKSQNRLLTHWLLMTLILVTKGKNYHKQFKCNYLRNKQKMYELFISFLEPILNFGRFLKRDEDHCSFISDITDSQRCCYLNAFIAMF